MSRLSLGRDLLLYLLGLVIFAVTLIVGIRTDVWGTVQDPSTAVLASLALSLGAFLVLDRIAAAMRDVSNYDRVASAIADLQGELPRAAGVFEFASSNDAMQELSSLIPNARLVLNTKVSKAAVMARSDVGQEYERAIEKGLRRGLTYRDVVSEGFVDYAESLTRYAEGKRGEYSYVVLREVAPVFLNFIVIEMPSGERQLIVGWATSAASGAEQKAFRLVDPRVIDYFVSYHAGLTSSSAK